jgi:hypothetical protein
MFVDFLKLFEAVNMDGSFPWDAPCSIWIHVDELKGFKDFSIASGMLSAIVSAANFAQIYP